MYTTSYTETLGKFIIMVQYNMQGTSTEVNSGLDLTIIHLDNIYEMEHVMPPIKKKTTWFTDNVTICKPSICKKQPTHNLYELNIHISQKCNCVSMSSCLDI